MKLTFFETSFFPFAVPEKDSSFAGSVGAGTVYPAGFNLDQALQIYWRAQDYQLVASGAGTSGDLSQSLSVNGLLPPRNRTVGTNSFGVLTGFAPTGPGDLVCGRGLQQVMPGTGSIIASGDVSGENDDAVMNLRVSLFYPEILVRDPVIKFDGLWWPVMSLSCSVTNTVELDDGGELDMEFACTSITDASHTTVIGSFTFFGATAVPVYSPVLAPPSGPDPGETRTFSGSLTVASEWP